MMSGWVRCTFIMKLTRAERDSGSERTVLLVEGH